MRSCGQVNLARLLGVGAQRADAPGLGPAGGPNYPGRRGGLRGAAPPTPRCPSRAPERGRWARPRRPRDPRAGAVPGTCPGLTYRRTRSGEAAARAALFGARPRGCVRSERGRCPDPRRAPRPSRLSAASCAPRAMKPARSRRVDKPGSRSEASRKSVSPGLSNGRLGN